jgi:caffeoyl-CoA O-methyltransferase
LEALDQYIAAHSDAEPPVLAQLNREAHLTLINPRMLSGTIQGRILKMLCRMIRPQRVLELGTYAGYSALCMAEGMTGGVIDTIEIDDELEDFIRQYLEQSCGDTQIHLHIGDALEIIPDLDAQYDLVFIDADKRLYNEYFDLVFDKVRPGGFILADNTLWDGKVIEPVNPKDVQTQSILAFNDRIAQDSRVEKVILPLRDGITLIYKK